ncbi:MAG: DsbA family protein [gamma proteobacterium symbiont of Taylorina sp.]|nr:DsbA family protein [gamma proteobacterium symbiont of Taylorina sp.]
MKIIIYYVHDPMCSWCWGFTETYEKFIGKLDDQFEVIRLLGGLAPDSNEPMNYKTKVMVQNAWHKIERTIPGIKFNFDYWKLNSPRRSTYLACRAVIAARLQGELFDVKMTKAIQTAYYKNAQNPSDMNILLQLAVDIGLNINRFKEDINSPDTQEILLSEIKQTHSLKANSFPSLIQKNNQSLYIIPIDYLDENVMLKSIQPVLPEIRF